jgi:hypothetical protein
VRFKEGFNKFDELSSKTKQGSKENNKTGPKQLRK